MARFRPFMIALLLLIPLIGAQAQTPTPQPPPQLAQAVAGLGSLLGVPLTVSDMESWTSSQGVYTDSALGCPYVYGQPLQQSISAFTFDLIYHNALFDYRVSVDGTIAFPCIRDGGGPLGATLTPTPQAINCPVDDVGYLAPRLQVGEQAQLIVGETPNRLRAQPSVNAQQVGMIQPGDMVSVIGGPSCEDASHIVWWQVSDMGLAGWTAEGQLPSHYFLMPMGSATPVSVVSPSATLPPPVMITSTPTRQIIHISASPIHVHLSFGTPTPTPKFQLAPPIHIGLVNPTPTISLHK